MEHIKTGGIFETTDIDEEDAFEMAVERSLGSKLRDSEALCAEMWSALANMTWHHIGGEETAYTFRAAGDLIAAVRGEGNYMDWYCSGPYATVSPEIALAMANEGWTATKAVA